MAGKIIVQVLDDTLEPEGWLLEGRPAMGLDVGAAAMFCGVCRSEDGRIAALELEHYPGMAEAEMHRIAEQACARFGLLGVLMVHRTGVVPAGEPIVLVGARSGHRDAAFDAVRFLMDYVKTDAPFWKREILVDGTSGPWVEAKASDDAARAKWAEPA